MCRMRRFGIVALVCTCAMVIGSNGCASPATKSSMSTGGPGVGGAPESASSSQPAADTAAQQLAGQLVAGVQSTIKTQLDAAVEAVGAKAGGNIGYTSQLGVGAFLLLAYALWTSHRRAMARIAGNGSVPKSA
jgi:hypothetical protein